MSTMPLTAPDAHLHGYDTFGDEVVGHLDVLHRVARRLTRQAQDAEDLVQETIARALDRRAQFHPGTNLRAWLLAIERSLFVDTYRRARRGPLTQSIDDVEEGVLYSRDGMAPSPSAESALLQEWMDPDLVAALHTLPEPYREAVELADVDGLSYAELAQRMGCPLGTVMSRLHRGRRLLRQALADRGRNPEAAVALETGPVQPLPAAA
jgi:RNA polymerase sigma-70 factor (ECF subfamily)